jgi:pilus assembly protein FimV
MLRKLGLCVAIASSLLVSKVNALGLGEITVKSALNQPLRAEIKLFQVKNLSPLQIKSRMADLNDFALSGLATQRALSGVRFQVRVRANGTGRIILTSKLPVTEPFMNFLVEVNWPSGRLIREYTLLLDPPANQSVVNNRNFNNNTGAKTTPAKVVKKNVSVRKTTSVSRPDVKKGQYYIGPKDTLWEVAIANRPSKRVTPQQMMVLIQRKNPNAFPNANINVMKARQVIDLPTQAEIDALSVKDAQDEVTRQTKLWKSGKLPKVVAQPAKNEADQKSMDAKDKSAKMDKTDAKDITKKDSNKKDASKDDAKDKEMKDMKAEPKEKGDPSMKDESQAAIDAMSTEKGMVDVVTPEQAALNKELQMKAEAMALAASKDSEKIADLLKNNAELDVKLALSQESIDKLERDNEVLNEKLNKIIKQLDDMNRLSMLKDEQLAALQVEREDELKDQQAEDKKEMDKSWLEKLLENPIGMAAAGIGWLVAVLTGLFLLLRRKKKDPQDGDVESEEKTEPSVSLPDEVVEDDLQSLEELEEPVVESNPADDIDDLDLDLDLDLDMDMELDETLEGAGAGLDLDEVDDSDDDLAAELEAQLTTDDDEDDDDLDLLEGMDGLDFDLGEVDDDQADLELDAEPELDAEQQAMAEFEAAMQEQESEPEELDASVEEDVLELDEMLEVDDLPVEEVSLEVPDELVEETFDVDELAVDDLEIEMPSQDEPNADDELLAGLGLDEADSQTVVEEDELDIADIADEVTSIDELEAEESLTLEEDDDASLDDMLNDLEMSPTESAEDDQLQMAESDVQSDIDDLLEIEMPDDGQGDAADSSDADLDAMMEELTQESSLDSNAQGDVSDLEIELVEEDIEDNDLQGALLEIEDDEPEESQIPMDNGLDDLLAADPVVDDEAPQALSEEVDQLLSSTDDEIALEEVAPVFDADNEEDIDLLAGEDGLRMKLDLARAYVEMGDSQGAKDIISEVLAAGDEEQRAEAQLMLDSLQS